MKGLINLWIKKKGHLNCATLRLLLFMDVGDIMNTLGYAILSALGRKPCSGYELVQYLDAVWPAKHSQIYPRLTKMEQNGLLIFEEVVQTGKPDKKIFSITEKGRETLEKWVEESPSDSDYA